MTKLEEIAKAISGSGVTSHASMRKARAAVEALRKPTPAMLTAAFARQTREELIYEGVWRAMVDAILNEKPETK